MKANTYPTDPPTHQPTNPDMSLGAEFRRCAARAQRRNQGRKAAALSDLAHPSDGRRVEFTKAARAKIPRSVIDEIR
jgi:hypothetical protein